MMKENQFSIAFKGTIEDNEHLHLSDFTKQLEVIRTVLNRIDFAVSKQSKQSTYYRIIDLSHSSPACVVLEAIPKTDREDYTTLIVGKFFRGLRDIINDKFPSDYDHRILKSLKKIHLSRSITEIKLSYNSEDIFIPKNLATKIDDLLGEENIEIMEESITGTLEMVDIHIRNKIRIYPIIGAKKIDGYFPDDLLETAKAGVNRYVNVEGKFKYKRGQPFPYEVYVTYIEIYPEEDELPTLFDLQGIAPNATGGVSSEEFVRRIRDNEW